MWLAQCCVWRLVCQSVEIIRVAVPLCSQVPWICICLGINLYILVSSNGKYIWSHVWLYSYIYVDDPRKSCLSKNAFKSLLAIGNWILGLVSWFFCCCHGYNKRWDFSSSNQYQVFILRSLVDWHGTIHVWIWVWHSLLLNSIVYTSILVKNKSLVSSYSSNLLAYICYSHCPSCRRHPQ